MTSAETKPLFVNFDESEESTCIEKIELMRFSFFKAYVATPVLSILTLFVLPVWMYWSVPTRIAMLYSNARSMEETTAICVTNKATQQKEVC